MSLIKATIPDTFAQDAGNYTSNIENKVKDVIRGIDTLTHIAFQAYKNFEKAYSRANGDSPESKKLQTALRHGANEFQKCVSEFEKVKQALINVDVPHEGLGMMKVPHNQKGLTNEEQAMMKELFGM